MSNFQLPKSYDFTSVEDRIYAWWEEQGFFKPTKDRDRRPYVLSMPPPNVTGELHLGHAMFVAMEDLMIRHSRMKGVPTLWVPGTDHAGIATQLQVEKHLMKTDGIRREDIGRDEFERRTWDWKRKYGGIITRQLRRLGASCDWERERFTLDDGLSKAVREAFVRLYEKGLIYRGKYVTNWCPRCHTALSNDEVEHEEQASHLWYINYPLKDGSGNVQVATTRPETMLGDTAVAVSPKDERYKKLVDKTCILPLVDKEIPIISDMAVDSEFGTGAVKVTPAHDPNDFEIAQRNDLPYVMAIGEDARMTENVPTPYQGLDRYACRENVVRDLDAQGYLVKIEDHSHAVGVCYRCKTVIEPLLSDQWFVRMAQLAKAAKDAGEDRRITIHPARWTKVYYHWLDNIRDWCISRQIWMLSSQ